MLRLIDRSRSRSGEPTVLVVTGVSGSGKSAVGALLAHRLGWTFADSDALHSPGSVAKMSAGRPLADADRAPWLARVAGWIDDRLRSGENGVIACSALKRAYRNALVRGRAHVRIVHLDGPQELIAKRLAHRRGHFMPALLLDSQFAALETPGSEENSIVVGIEDDPEKVVDAIVGKLGRSADRTV